MEERTVILAVDDDPDLLQLVKSILTAAGYQVLTAPDAARARALVQQSPVHLLVLDIAMPGEDGVSLCRSLRSSTTAPVLFLTARSQDADKVAGFEAGGDDFLTKPFSRVELLSRVKALLRRCYEYPAPDQPGDLLRRGQLLVDRRARTVQAAGQPVELTATEFAFLLMMMEHPGQVFSARELYEATWEESYTHASNNAVLVHISNLRRKLGDNPRHPAYIKNIWGRGYYVE